MRKMYLLSAMAIAILLSVIHFNVNAQMGISTTGDFPAPCAMLDVKSTSSGFLLPRMTKAQRNAITSKVRGLMIFQTDDSTGFQFYNGTGWELIGRPDGHWSRNGNNIVTSPADNVGIGTTSPVNKLSVNGSVNITGHSAIGADAVVDFANSLYGSPYISTLVVDEVRTIADASAYHAGILNLHRVTPSVACPGFWGIDNEIMIPQENQHGLDWVNPFYNSVIHQGLGNTGILDGIENHVILMNYGSTVDRMCGIFNEVKTQAQNAEVNLLLGFDNNINLFQPYRTIPNTYGIRSIIFQTGYQSYITNAYNGYFWNRTSDGHITNSYGVFVETPEGTMTNNYGIYINNQPGYNLYSKGATTWNFFEGKVGIGNVSPQYALDVTGTINGVDINATGAYKTDGNTVIDPQGFIIPKSSTDASAPNNAIYYSTDQSALVYKDSSGIVHPLY